MAGTNGGTVSKYPTVLVYDRRRKYTARNMTPIKHSIPPHIRHQITYFRTPGGWGTAKKNKKNSRIKLYAKYKSIDRENYKKLGESRKTLSIKKIKFLQPKKKKLFEFFE